MAEATEVRRNTTAVAHGAGQELIQRAPAGYLWNQAYSLWLYLSLFFFQLVITRLLPVDEKGVYELILTPANFAVYLAALGLESAASVYVPRALVESGAAEASAVALRLVVVRVLAVAAVATGVVWGLPALAQLLTATGLPWLADPARQLVSPVLSAHRLVMATYVVCTGLANLLGALLTALLRTRLVFILGSLAQLLSVGAAYVVVGPLHGAAGGALLALSLPAGVLSVAYAVALARVLGMRQARVGPHALRGMLSFGLTVWLADLANGSLVKLLAVYQLGLVVSHADIAFFGIAFEMGHSASFLLVAGLGGVGLAIMAAAYAGRQMEHLTVAWRSIAKVQVVLAVPLVAFCIPNAQAIVVTLYKEPYAAAGPLLALFLVFNGLVRMAGGGASEAVLYVLGRQRWVVGARWISLVVLGACDVLLIPTFGAAGALFAVGIAQTGVEFFELALARHWLAARYPVGFVVKVLMAVTPALVVTTLWRAQSLAGLIASGAVFAVLFLVGLRLFAPLDAQDAQLIDQVREPLRSLLRVFMSRGARRQAHIGAGAETEASARLTQGSDGQVSEHDR